jgi:hypothetical protein
MTLDTHLDRYTIIEEDDAFKIIAGVSAFDLDASTAKTAHVYFGNVLKYRFDKDPKDGVWYVKRFIM